MRPSIAFLTIAALAASASEASACCLTDWLFGRTATPYAVGYAPLGTPVATGPYVVGIPPTTTVTAARPALVNPLLGSGVYQLQRPAYIDNRSVYTGMPVTGNVQSVYRVPSTAFPPATMYRGSVPNTTALGGGNQYPNQYSSGYSSGSSSGYSSGQGISSIPGQPLTITNPSGAPATALPATQVAPLYPVAPPRVGGLRRFFGRLFGTEYRSSYYRAPVTYYRPVTTVDPVTGTTVTVQRPCTSYVQQLQRTPLTTYQSAQPAMIQPSAGCSTPMYGSNGLNSSIPSTYGQSFNGQTYNGQSNVGQAGAWGQTGQTVPIPSAVPGSGYGTVNGGYGYGAAPLTGSPPSPSASGDRAPVDQPRLETLSPPSGSDGSSPPASSEQPAPSSYWQLQNADDSTAMIRGRVETSQRSDPVSLRGGVEPIRAPDDYISPFRSRSQSVPVTPLREETFRAPPLPERSITDPSDLTSVSTRVDVPLREAALVRPLPRAAVAKPRSSATKVKRDSTWYPVGQ